MVEVVVSCRQTDPRYRVFPERQLPGRLKQTGVCEGLLGKKSRELYDLLTFTHDPFCLSSPLAKTNSLAEHRCDHR